MTLSFLRTAARHRVPRGVPRDLAPHLMRDIGLDRGQSGQIITADSTPSISST